MHRNNVHVSGVPFSYWVVSVFFFFLCIIHPISPFVAAFCFDYLVLMKARVLFWDNFVHYALIRL